MQALIEEEVDGDNILSQFGLTRHATAKYASASSTQFLTTDELRRQLEQVRQQLETSKALNKQLLTVNNQAQRLTGQPYNALISSSRTSISAMTYQEITQLNPENVQEFIAQIRQHQLNNLELTLDTRNRLLRPVSHSLIPLTRQTNPSDHDWEQWEHEKLIDYLREQFPLQRKDKSTTSYRDILRAIHLNLRNPPTGLLNFINALTKVAYDTPPSTKDGIPEREAVKVVIEGICPAAMKPHAHDIYVSIKEDLDGRHIQTWDKLIEHLWEIQLSQKTLWLQTQRYPIPDGSKWQPGQTLGHFGKKRPRDEHTTENRGGGGNSEAGQPKHPKGPKPNKPSSNKPLCDGCGRRSSAASNHTRSTCKFTYHPEFNAHGAWPHKDKILPIKNKLDGTSLTEDIPKELTDIMAAAKSRGGSKKCKSPDILAATASQTYHHDLLSCIVSCNACCDNPILTSHTRTLLTTPTTTPYSHVRCVEALPDTGALQRNYVSREFADWLMESTRGKGDSSSSCTCTCRECTVITPATNAPKVCSGFANDRSNSMCAVSLGTIKFSLHFLNELTNNVETITGLEAVILNSDFDLI